MDIKVGDLVSIKSKYPGRNFNIHYLPCLGVITKLFQSATLKTAKSEHHYEDYAEIEWIKFEEFKGKPDQVQPLANLIVVSES